MKITTKASVSVGAKIKASRERTPAIDEPTKNFRDDHFANKIAPPKVPSSFPKK